MMLEMFTAFTVLTVAASFALSLQILFCVCRCSSTSWTSGGIFVGFFFLCGCHHLLLLIPNAFRLSALITAASSVASLLALAAFFHISSSLRACLIERQTDNDSIKAKVGELQRACEQAQQSNQQKGEFLTFLCHEIRNPCQAITANVDLLLDTKLAPQQLEYIHGVNVSVDLMLHIVNDVLDMSRLQSGKLVLENIQVNLRSLMNVVRVAHQPLATIKGITFDTHVADDVPQWIAGDPTRIHQIIINLVNNAIKFTKHGAVTVTWTRVPRRIRNRSTNDILSEHGQHPDHPIVDMDEVHHSLIGPSPDRLDVVINELELEVRDTGEGIADPSKLFIPYSQGNLSTARHHGGTGLGLSICRNIIELMGGTITCTSTVQVGTSFIVRLPLHPIHLPIDVTYNPSTHHRHSRIIHNQSSTSPSLSKSLTSAPSSNSSFPDTATSSPISVTSSLLLLSSVSGDDSQNARSASQNSALLLPHLYIRPLVPMPCRNLSPVLVVDDNIINCKVLHSMISSWGLEVETVGNGEQAVVSVRKRQQSHSLPSPYLIILMDLVMPVLDGYQASRAIRDLGCQTPIISVTATGLTAESNVAHQCGMQAVIHKPVRQPQLKQIIQQYTGLTLNTSGDDIWDWNMAHTPSPTSKSSSPSLRSSSLSQFSPPYSGRGHVRRLSRTKSHPTPTSIQDSTDI